MAVRNLREHELLRTVHRPGERSEKHLHLMDRALELSPGQIAVLAVLLLRGPQTAAELRARTERMHPFGSVTEVEEALQSLGARAEPLVERLERQPGQKEARYADLLVGSGASQPWQPDQAEPAPAPEPADDIAALAAEVRQLRAEVEQLRAELRATAPTPEF
jgi:uncharacterized protein YceH (UPF0502 family)